MSSEASNSSLKCSTELNLKMKRTQHCSFDDWGGGGGGGGGGGRPGIASKEENLQKLLKNVYSKVNPMDDETIFYCKRELGDIMWYWINSVQVPV